jgi:NAD(P)H-hydrate epimerase
MLSIPVITPDQAAAWDAAAVAAGRSLGTLMETAGRAVARVILDDHGEEAARGVLVACGPGNNGGDGWVTARALHLLGLGVWVAEVGTSPKGIAAEARRAALEDGVATVAADGPWPAIHLVVDALLGTGARGAPREPMPALLARLVALQVPIVAIDGPTGLDLATGVDHGANPAATTVTFGGVRRGHLIGRDDAGTIIVAEIGLPAADPHWPVLIDARWAGRRLAPFAADSHKGNRGRVVVVGGSAGMTGAARLAARGAFAAGAGLVHVVAPDDAIGDVALAEPDVQAFAHPFRGEPSAELRALLTRADAVVFGPGFGRDEAGLGFLEAALELVERAVVDADALTLLRGQGAAVARLSRDREVVLTPHPGEFRSVFPALAGQLETDPWGAAAAAAREVGATVLLKGVPTVVAPPVGQLLTVAAGNPGLATGGSGDVLSGIIGALLARGTSPRDAAAIGAQALGDAADIAAIRHGTRGMRPMQVIEALGDVWPRWAAEPHRPDRELLRLPRPETG